MKRLICLFIGHAWERTQRECFGGRFLFIVCTRCKKTEVVL